MGEREGLKINLRSGVNTWLREAEIRLGRSPTVLCTAGLLVLRGMPPDARDRALILAQLVDSEAMSLERFSEVQNLEAQKFAAALEKLIAAATTGTAAPVTD